MVIFVVAIIYHQRVINIERFLNNGVLYGVMETYKIDQNTELSSSPAMRQLAKKYGVIDELKGKGGKYLLAPDAEERIKVMKMIEGQMRPTEISGFYMRDGDSVTIMESTLQYLMKELVPKLPDQLVPRVELRPLWLKADYEWINSKDAKGTMKTKIRATIEEGQPITQTYGELEFIGFEDHITQGMRARAATEAMFTTRSLKDGLEGQIEMMGATEAEQESLRTIMQTESALTRYLSRIEENPTEAFEVYLPVMDPGYDNMMWKNAFRDIFLKSETAKKEMDKMLGRLSRTKERMESEEFEEPVEIIMVPRDRDEYTIIPEE